MQHLKKPMAPVINETKSQDYRITAEAKILQVAL